jgi:preprotein translocase subunit SecA
MAQRDPLIEYQREGFDMFNAMMDGIKEESVGALFNLQVEVQQNPVTDETFDGAAGANGANGADGQTVVAGGIQMSAGPQVTSTPQGTQGAASPSVPDTPPEEFTETPTRAGGRATNGSRGNRSGSSRSGAGRHRSGATGPQPAVSDDAGLPAGLAPRRSSSLQYTAPSVDGGNHVETHAEGNPASGNFANVGRNDPCPCGSGRKFKRCHGDPRNRETV